MNSIKTIVAALVICAFASGCITSFDGTIVPTSSEVLCHKMFESEYEASNGVKMMVRTYVPDDALPNSLPLVVYLHGAGQNGNDNKKQLDGAVGCIYSFMEGRDDYKAVVVVPQCPVGVYWRNDEMLEALKDLIEFYSEHPMVDSSRIYITGFSMGGDASWKLALNWPTLMTTIIPVCGGPMTSMEPDIPIVPSEMADLNIWAFNNFDDGVVRPSYAKRIFGVLWSENDSDRLNFTENITGGHNGDKVYKNRDVLIWMMSTRKAE